MEVSWWQNFCQMSFNLFIQRLLKISSLWWFVKNGWRHPSPTMQNTGRNCVLLGASIQVFSWVSGPVRNKGTSERLSQRWKKSSQSSQVYNSTSFFMQSYSGICSFLCHYCFVIFHTLVNLCPNYTEFLPLFRIHRMSQCL